MQFNSIDYLLFFPLVLLVYFVIPKRTREVWLLISSYYFYMSWNAKYAVLIGFSTLVTYLGARLIDRQEDVKGRKLTLVCVVLSNLAVLFVFKYANFALDSAGVLLNFFGRSFISKRFDFVLPVGISFYTFQALGYIIDVYRGQIKSERNIIRYALFVSFFPQLVAGPIERSKNLLGQLENIREVNLWNSDRIAKGFIQIIYGLFLKMVISDRVALLVNDVFAGYRMYGSTELILGACGFALQIYCDFYSYSIIAKGSACIMGIELMDNFNTPYFATSIKDFWSRWHISLSTWFRDYLYIPLGGNRKGKVRKYINLLVVFFVSGLWHGASWNYVIWGVIHGIYQIVGDMLGNIRAKAIKIFGVNTECFSWKFLKIITTNILVVFAWIFFRAESLTVALKYCQRIFTRPTPWTLFNGGIYEIGLSRSEMNVLLASAIIMAMIELVKYVKKQRLEEFLYTQNMWFRWTVLIALIVAVFVYGEYGPQFDVQQFIYFQF